MTDNEPDPEPSPNEVDGPSQTETRFAPNPSNDNRREGDWATRYPDREARHAIVLEALFVAACFALALAGILGVTTRELLVPAPDGGVAYQVPRHLALAFFGGFLGGTLFTMKWLYHSVAKGLWNRDRRLWRIFTPLLSSGAAFTIMLLCEARILPLFGPELIHEPKGALGLAIVFGYFSDRVFSALENFADGLGLGARERSRKQSQLPADEPDLNSKSA